MSPTLRGLAYRGARALGIRVLPPTLEDARATPPPGVRHSPELRFGTAIKVARDAIRDYVREHGRRGRFLDVGGGASGLSAFAGPLDYYLLDLEPPEESERSIRGDISDCPQLPSDSFDVVFCRNMLEFVAEPWRAAAEIGRVLKPGGIAIVITCFAWRYHPGSANGPPDYWRYTHSGLEYVFGKYGGLEAVLSGYDLSQRRENMLGGKLPNDLDRPPVDELGGFRENWYVYYAGRRPDAVAERT